MHKLVCAWCTCTIRDGGDPVSHGICEKCGKEFRGQEAELQELRELSPEIAVEFAELGDETGG